MNQNEEKSLMKEFVVESAKKKVKRYLWVKLLLPLLPVLLIIGGFLGLVAMSAVLSQTGSKSDNLSGEISQLGSDEIPKEYIEYYKEAEKEYGIPWNVIAAIHKVETNFGTIDPMVSSAGAVGHMQFMKQTWVGWSAPYPTINGLGDIAIPNSDLMNPEIIARYGGYGVDANKDKKADPFNAHDAIFSAGNYLKANGGETDIRKAVFAYNHADWYVDKVLKIAESYVNAGSSGGGGKGDGTWKNPVRTPYQVSQEWDSINVDTLIHGGIDLASTPVGSKPPIYCAKAGKVLVVGSNLGYEGNYVMVEHEGGFVTYYGHFDSVSVTQGQQVTNETVLGIMGQTGLATGVHLHFEVRQGGSSANSRINPRDVIGF